MYRTFSLRERSPNVLRRGVSVRETATETALAAAKAPSRLPAGHGGVREEQTADQKGGQGPQDRGASGVAGAVESVEDRECRRRAQSVAQDGWQTAPGRRFGQAEEDPGPIPEATSVATVAEVPALPRAVM